MFDPSKPLELDMLARPSVPADFIEETVVTVDQRQGWAPPRRRPRRVFEKLERRGFKAHFADKRPFAGARADIQQRVMQRSAPGLVAWLDNHARDDGTRPLMVRFVPVMFDGRDPPRIVPREFWGKDSIETTEEAALPLEVASGDDPPFIERRSTTWIGRHFGAGVIVLSPLAERRIEFYAIVYSPPGVDERPVRLAFNAAAKSVHKAIILAARGMTSTRIVARQSPCRPRWAHGG